MGFIFVVVRLFVLILFGDFHILKEYVLWNSYPIKLLISNLKTFKIYKYQNWSKFNNFLA